MFVGLRNVVDQHALLVLNRFLDDRILADRSQGDGLCKNEKVVVLDLESSRDLVEQPGRLDLDLIQVVVICNVKTLDYCLSTLAEVFELKLHFGHVEKTPSVQNVVLVFIEPRR